VVPLAEISEDGAGGRWQQGRLGNLKGPWASQKKEPVEISYIYIYIYI
jgi:hypothetical protein